jgi:hypothetical protein
MNEHVDELGEGIVKASTQAAMAYIGDPTAADAPHHLDVWGKYLRGLDPTHRPPTDATAGDERDGLSPLSVSTGAVSDAPKATPVLRASNSKDSRG